MRRARAFPPTTPTFPPPCTTWLSFTATWAAWTRLNPCTGRCVACVGRGRWMCLCGKRVLHHVVVAVCRRLPRPCSSLSPCCCLCGTQTLSQLGDNLGERHWMYSAALCSLAALHEARGEYSQVGADRVDSREQAAAPSAWWWHEPAHLCTTCCAPQQLLYNHQQHRLWCLLLCLCIVPAVYDTCRPLSCWRLHWSCATNCSAAAASCMPTQRRCWQKRS